ncbi:MAG: hypothetical protein AAF628_38035, partial [Planctomycetota bacterium]
MADSRQPSIKGPRRGRRFNVAALLGVAVGMVALVWALLRQIFPIRTILQGRDVVRCKETGRPTAIATTLVQLV